MWQIDFYRQANGDSPALDFINMLDTKMRAKIVREITILEQFGNTLKEPYSNMSATAFLN